MNKAFIDIRCKKCNTKIGWFGTMADAPACHKCGIKPDLEELKADEEEMEKFEQLLLNRKKK